MKAVFDAIVLIGISLICWKLGYDWVSNHADMINHYLHMWHIPLDAHEKSDAMLISMPTLYTLLWLKSW